MFRIIKIFWIFILIGSTTSHAIDLSIPEIRKNMSVSPAKTATLCLSGMDKINGTNIEELNSASVNSKILSFLKLCFEEQTLQNKLPLIKKEKLAKNLSDLLIKWLEPKYAYNHYYIRDSEYWFRIYLWGYLAKHSDKKISDSIIKRVTQFMNSTPFEKVRIPEKWNTSDFVHNINYIFYFLNESALFDQAWSNSELALKSGYYKKFWENYNIYRDRINIFKNQGQLSKAASLIEEFNETWKKSKNKKEYWAANIHLASINIAKGKEKVAREQLDQLLRTVKDFGPFWVAWTNMQYLILDIRQSRYKKARERIELIEDRYGNARAGVGKYHTYLMKAGLYLTERNFQSAKKYLDDSEEILIKRALNFSGIHFYLMKALFFAMKKDKSGFDQIKKQFSQALRHSNDKEKFDSLINPMAMAFKKNNQKHIQQAIKKRDEAFEGFPYTYLHDPALISLTQ